MEIKHKLSVGEKCVYKLGSASVAFERLSKAGVIEVSYYGMIDPASFDYLRSKLLDCSQSANALVIRMDRSLMLMAHPPPIPEGIYDAQTPPAAIVVRDQDFEVWSTYGKALATCGVMRSVFLSQQSEKAYQWAEFQAAAKPARWHLTPHLAPQPA
jgi:hypothetical protein